MLRWRSILTVESVHERAIYIDEWFVTENCRCYWGPLRVIFPYTFPCRTAQLDFLVLPKFDH